MKKRSENKISSLENNQVNMGTSLKNLETHQANMGASLKVLDLSGATGPINEGKFIKIFSK